MEKEDVLLLAQLFHTMKELIPKLERAHKKKDAEKLNALKREMMGLQRRINELL